jgi:hypothetical protein
MKSRLIVNPLAYVARIKGSEDLSLGGPVPGRGLTAFRLSRDVDSDLHTVIGDLLDVGIANLDIEKDLNSHQAALLEEHGVLVTEDNVPQQPLFSCMLKDVPTSDALPDEMIVNPTIEFRPFDLTQFRSLAANHLSPHAPTVWINDPDSGVRWGYWLGADEAEVIRQFNAGDRAGLELAPDMASRLFAARILIDGSGERASDRKRAIDDAAEEFQRDRYAVLENIVEPTQLGALQSYFRRYAEQGFMVLGDGQVPLRFAQNDEPVAAIIHHSLTSMMSRLAGVAVRPTYSYTAVYIGGADLKPHTDRGECVFSFSLQVDYSPAPDTGISPWALYLARHDDPNRIDPATDVAIHLANGSCVAYMGQELVHYRTPLPEGHRSMSLFFHYVAE